METTDNRKNSGLRFTKLRTLLHYSLTSTFSIKTVKAGREMFGESQPNY